MGKELTRAQEAAVLLMALEEDHAAALLGHISEGSLVRLREAAESLDVSEIGEEAKRKVLQRFLRRQQTGSLPLGDTDERFRRVLVKAKGEDHARRICAKREPEPGQEPEFQTPIDAIEHAPDEDLQQLLETESPRCVAVLLSRLSPMKAGQLLSELPEELKEGVVSRLLTSEGAPASVVDQIFRCFEERLAELESGDQVVSEEERHGQLAGMIGSLDQESQQRVLARVAKEDPEMAEKLERLMFGFGDLVKVSGKSMQELVRRVEVPALALALKGAPEEVQQQFSSNLSQRARERVQEEREIAGRVPLSQVEEAREEIMKVARQMRKDGELQVQIGGEQYVE